eukprot:6925365-Prymnesium_polylepis.1
MNCGDGAGGSGILDDQHDCVGDAACRAKAAENQDYGARLAAKIKAAVLRNRGSGWSPAVAVPASPELSRKRKLPEDPNHTVYKSTNFMRHAEKRTYLNCFFAEKDQAKKLGARWDSLKRSWYVPEGEPIAPFARWLGSQHSSKVCRHASNDGLCMTLGEQGLICKDRHPGNPSGEYCYATPWKHPYRSEVMSNRCYEHEPWYVPRGSAA